MALDIFKSYNRKVAAQMDAAATVQARRQLDAEAVQAQQAAVLESMRPANQLPAAAPKAAPRAPAKNYWPYIAGAAAVLALLLSLRKRK